MLGDGVFVLVDALVDARPVVVVDDEEPAAEVDVESVVIVALVEAGASEVLAEEVIAALSVLEDELSVVDDVEEVWAALVDEGKTGVELDDGLSVDINTVVEDGLPKALVVEAGELPVEEGDQVSDVGDRDLVVLDSAGWVEVEEKLAAVSELLPGVTTGDKVLTEVELAAEDGTSVDEVWTKDEVLTVAVVAEDSNLVVDEPLTVAAVELVLPVAADVAAADGALEVDDGLLVAATEDLAGLDDEVFTLLELGAVVPPNLVVVREVVLPVEVEDV